MSEPMVSYDNIGFYLLSREVSKHIKVVQSGQGADEVFAGYHWYPKLTGSNRPVQDYAAAFFDRTEEQMAEAVSPDYHCASDESLAFVEAILRAPVPKIPSTRLCASTPTSCSSTIRSNASTIIPWPGALRRACRSSIMNWWNSPGGSRPNSSWPSKARAF
jgi:asparagine synthetase B (glutamine-hydrolysing)